MTAYGGFNTRARSGAFEIRFALEPPNISADQGKILQSARAAAIHTFGWPIGVVLENNAECRPQTRPDGVSAMLNFDREDRGFFDYWSIRRNGDFYLLKSLFEDERDIGKLYFDTRIVRTTEAVLYCRNLLTALGAAGDSRVHFHASYKGLGGRELTGASPGRHLFPRKISADESEAETSFLLKDVDENIISIVKDIISPILILFDFFELSDEVYSDIVSKVCK